MLLPIKTDRPLRRTPAVNLGLLLANVVMFWVQNNFPVVESTLLLRPHEPTLLALFGSAFMHGGFFHLLGNMLFLYIFGNNINDKLGNIAYLGFYLGGALAAGLIHVAVESAPALGASGAVAAVTGAYLVFFPRSRIVVLFFFFIIMFLHIPALWFIGIFFLLDVIRGLDARLLGGATSIAHWAHIGGSLYGMSVALLLLGTKLVGRDQMDLLAILRRWKLRRDHAAVVRRAGTAGQKRDDILPKAQEDPRVAQVQAVRERITEAFARDNLREAARLYLQLMRLDPEQVLSMQRQLDVANQLFADGRHADAAAAYERFLNRYGQHEEHARTQLMLGLIYGRYLDDTARARSHLEAAADRLDEEDARVARGELERLDQTHPAPQRTP